MAAGTWGLSGYREAQHPEASGRFCAVRRNLGGWGQSEKPPNRRMDDVDNPAGGGGREGCVGMALQTAGEWPPGCEGRGQRDADHLRLRVARGVPGVGGRGGAGRGGRARVVEQHRSHQPIHHQRWGFGLRRFGPGWGPTLARHGMDFGANCSFFVCAAQGRVRTTVSWVTVRTLDKTPGFMRSVGSVGSKGGVNKWEVGK